MKTPGSVFQALGIQGFTLGVMERVKKNPVFSKTSYGNVIVKMEVQPRTN